jgi:hypothetical protein
MFIVERRTAGVLAALATAAAMAVLGNVWDRVDEGATPSTANSTAAFATSVGPGVSANCISRGRSPSIPGCAGVHRATGGGPSLHAAVRTNRDEEVIRKHAELCGIPFTRIVEVP